MLGLYDNLPGDMLLEVVRQRQIDIREGSSWPGLLTAVRGLGGRLRGRGWATAGSRPRERRARGSDAAA